MGVEALATAIVGQILVPLLTKGADAVVDGLSSRLENAAEAGGVAGVAQRIFARVRDVFGEAGEADALDQLKQRPEAATPLVTSILEEQLARDESLMAELAGMLDEKPGGGASVGSIMADYVGYVDARGAHIERSQVVGQSFGAPPRTVDQEQSQG